MTTHRDEPATPAEPTTLDAAAALLAGHFDPAPAVVDETILSRLALLIEARGYSLTGLARAMGRSHTWVLRKLDPAHPSARACTLVDVVEILDALGASPEDLMATELPD